MVRGTSHKLDQYPESEGCPLAGCLSLAWFLIKQGSSACIKAQTRLLEVDGGLEARFMGTEHVGEFCGWVAYLNFWQ